MPRSKREKLIINADDFGLSENFNKGILELADRNIVTSTSALVDEKHALSKDIRKHPVSIGLHIDLSENLEDSAIKKEIGRQIRKFVSLYGRLPSHLNGHKNCHLIQKIFPKIIEVAKKYNLPIRSTNDKNRIAIREAGLRTPSRLVWWNVEYKHVLFQDLQKDYSGVTELLCHPGYFDPKSISSYNKQREKELKILKSVKFKNLLKSFELVNYSNT